MTPAAEPPGGASGSLSRGEPPKPVCKEAPGQEGRLESLENFLIQERPSHGTFWTISKGEGAQKSSKWGPDLFCSRETNAKGQTAHTCEMCTKTFRYLSRLVRHQATHSGEKPHACGHCGRAFTRLSTLHRHQRVHSGEKPFGCQWCGKPFSYSTLLAQHQRIHTRERPFRCSKYGKSFIWKSSFRTHQKSHLCSQVVWISVS